MLYKTIFTYVHLITTRRLATTTDRASAFVVDHIEICPTSSLNTMSNLVVVSHTVCVHVAGPNNLGDAGPHPLGRGMSDALETRYSSTYVITSNFVILGQMVWA